MRKIAAHIAFTGEDYILNPLIELDEKGTILSVGQFSTEQGEPAGTEFFSGILVPGFFNAHTHLELSYSGCTYDKGKGMSDFVSHVIETRKKYPSLSEGSLKSVYRKIFATGTRACADICNSPLTFPTKSESKLLFRNFFEFFALSSEQAKKQLEIFTGMQKDFPLADLYPSFHSPYAMSEDGLAILMDSFLHKKISSLHFRESKEEFNLSDENNSLVRFYRKLNPDFEPAFPSGKWTESQGEYLRGMERLILVHNTFLSEKEIVELKVWGEKHKIKLGFVLCPRSNMNIHREIPPVDLFLKHNLTLCLGTDSLLSVSNLSILDEMKFLAQKFPFLKLSDFLKMTSSNPADLLGFNSIGKIESGKAPGLNVIVMKNLRSDILDQDAELIRLV